jgi:hypothetical protein
MDEYAHPRNPEDYVQEIRRLREENEHLRESSRAFGELAERLRLLLETERQRHGTGPVEDAPPESFSKGQPE